ncbi:MAG: hypothetical protein C0501_28185 [Isosphaera sp.]|nr:hypothetical protein [Isosphaera sp.]
MIQTEIVHQDPADPVPERFVELVRRANEQLKEETGPAEFPVRATWTVRGGREPRADLTISCYGGEHTAEYVESQLRDPDRLSWPLTKHYLLALREASKILAEDTRRHLARIGMEVE